MNAAVCKFFENPGTYKEIGSINAAGYRDRVIPLVDG
jgi:hypothetical protein